MPAEMCTLWKDSISFREEPSNSSQMDQDNSQLQFYISNTLHRRQEGENLISFSFFFRGNPRNQTK